MAASINIAKCRDAKEAEACAIREGIKMGLGLNLLPATIESDCDIAIAAANKLQTKSVQVLERVQGHRSPERCKPRL
jgi:hypothetical protein